MKVTAHNDITQQLIEDNPSIKGLAMRLSVVMFLEFVVFGSWFATLGLVLASSDMQASIGSAYFVSAIAAIVSPLCLGAIGDRYLAPKLVLCFAHATGALLLLAMPTVVASGQSWLVLTMIFVYMLTFQPTLSLVNSIALVLLGKQQRYFPYVRLFGPLGWVFAGIIVGTLGYSSSTHVFYVGSVAGFILAVYALTLPRTEPPAAGARFSLGDAIGLRALPLFKQRAFSVLMLCIFLTSISLSFYNTFASPYLGALGISNVAGTLSLGQLSEVVFILTIPWLQSRIGIKWVFCIGMAMWSVRFALFVFAAYGDSQLAIIGVALHGICNDYFIVVAAMFIARLAPEHLAAQAQGWLILMVSGFGAAFGSHLAGGLFEKTVLPNADLAAQAWTTLWTFPIGLAIATTAIWLLLFPKHHPTQAVTPAP